MAKQSDFIMLKNVRLFYPNVWTPRRPMAGNDGSVKEGKCGTTILLYDQHAVDDPEYKGKDDENIKKIQQAIIEMCHDNNPTKDHKTNQGAIVPPERMALRKGEHLGKPEIFHVGMWRFSASCRRIGDIPTVLGQYTAKPIQSAEENDFYSGCMANVKVRVRWMDGFKADSGEQVPPMVLGELIAIQFEEDAPALDAAYVSEEDAVEGFMPAEGQPMETYEANQGDAGGAPASDADMFG